VGIKSVEVISAKLKDRWVKVSLEAVKESMKNIYRITKKKDLNLALMNARDFYRGDEDLQREVGFISKLIQLEASGYLEPPINISKMYQEVIRSMSVKEENVL